MSNVTVQKALTNAIHMIDVLQTSGLNLTPEGAQVKADCEAALSKIEKCEPSAYLYSQDISGEENVVSNLSLYKIENLEYQDSKWNVTKLYTSPQPRDWVGLSETRIKELMVQNMIASALDRDSFAKAINDELKQLNTKG